MGSSTVLIVDDDEAVVQCFSRMLTLCRYAVLEAHDVMSGLHHAEQRRPDAIVLDLHMPVADGLDFLRAVRGRPGLVEVPVAIVTGDYMVNDTLVAEIHRLGAQLRFKPLWLEDLVALVDGLVGRVTR